MKKYVIGIDGGGSNTVVAIGDEKQILAQHSFPASNYHNVGIEPVKSVLMVAIDHMCEAIGISPAQVEAICFGGAGVDTPADEVILLKAFRQIGYSGKIRIVNDGLIALVGANEAEEGAIIISGTGSIGMGLVSGIQHRVGGWGHIIGDEGSGYAIGRDALKAIAKASDGRAPINDLFETLSKPFGFKTPDDIIHFLYGADSGKDAVAKLAPYVIDLYQTDEAAKGIVDQNIMDLVEMSVALSRRMGVEAFQLAVSGSVLVKNDFMFDCFKKEVAKALPEVSVIRAKHHPVYGAIQMARKIV